LLHDSRAVIAADIERTPRRKFIEERKIKQWFDNTNVNCNRRVLDGLASNVAIFHARGKIGEEELEDMLVHIVSVDHGLFNLVALKIETEKKSYCCGIVPCPHIHRPTVNSEVYRFRAADR
jgi:hypothetical protein